MRGADYEARWNVIRPQYGEYLPNFNGQRKETGSVSHSRVARVPVRVPDSQDAVLRKMPSNN